MKTQLPATDLPPTLDELMEASRVPPERERDRPPEDGFGVGFNITRNTLLLSIQGDVFEIPVAQAQVVTEAMRQVLVKLARARET